MKRSIKTVFAGLVFLGFAESAVALSEADRKAIDQYLALLPPSPPMPPLVIKSMHEMAGRIVTAEKRVELIGAELLVENITPPPAELNPLEDLSWKNRTLEEMTKLCCNLMSGPASPAFNP